MATAKERAKRIMLVLGHVLACQAAGETVLVEDLLERFDLTGEELVADMDLAFQYVGVAPFTPDSYVTVFVEDGVVDLEFSEFFHRPLHLTPEEAVLLLTAGRGMLEGGGLRLGEGEAAASPLGRAVAKVEAALGASGQELDVELGRADPAVLSLVAAATEEHRSLEIDYLSFHRDDASRRTVDPHLLHAGGGYWYLQAWCHTAEDFRMFRVDRIATATPTGATFEPREDDLDPLPGAPSAAAASASVVLDVPPSARWVAETYPVERVSERGDGRLEITISAGTTAFLERLLLRLGDDVTAIRSGTGESVLPVRAAAAARILRRYR